MDKHKSIFTSRSRILVDAYRDMRDVDPEAAKRLMNMALEKPWVNFPIIPHPHAVVSITLC